MSESISIRENDYLLKKIVAEKGSSSYQHRYYWILQEIISKDTPYEELSDESKAILRQETGLDEEFYINTHIACLDTKQLHLLKDDEIELYAEQGHNKG